MLSSLSYVSPCGADLGVFSGYSLILPVSGSTLPSRLTRNPVYQIEPSGAAIGSCGNELGVGKAHSWNDTFSVPGRITAGGAGCGGKYLARYSSIAGT